MTADKQWVLDGAVNVQNGAILNIEPGTKIYGQFGPNTAYLSIQQGGKIYAEGTSDKPIVFSTIRKITSIPQPGDWGGIILNGKAPINEVGGIAEGEGGSGIFGGSDPMDNSGVLKYVIVEYGRKFLGVGSEMNNISLNGCGSETIVDNVQALYGKDDGIEIFGGTVNIAHAVSMGNADDGIDWTGKGQYWLIVQDDHQGDQGIEADNNENDYLANTISNPIISNVTIIGKAAADIKNSGVLLRHGTKGEFYNFLVTGFTNNGIEVRDSSLQYINQDLLFENSYVFDNQNNFDESVKSFEQKNKTNTVYGFYYKLCRSCRR